MRRKVILICVAVMAVTAVSTVAAIGNALAVTPFQSFAVVALVTAAVGYILHKTVSKPVPITIETARRNVMMASMRNKAFQERNYDDA